MTIKNGTSETSYNKTPEQIAKDREETIGHIIRIFTAMQGKGEDIPSFMTLYFDRKEDCVSVTGSASYTDMLDFAITILEEMNDMHQHPLMKAPLNMLQILAQILPIEKALRAVHQHDEKITHPAPEGKQ